MVAEGIIHGTTSPPMREKIAEWAIAAKLALTEECIKMHGGMATTVGFQKSTTAILNTLYINACAIFLLHLQCSHLLLLVQKTSRMFHVFCVFSWATMVDREVEVER